MMKRSSIASALVAAMVAATAGVASGGDPKPQNSRKAQAGSKAMQLPDGGIENPTAMPNKPKPSTAMPNKPKPSMPGGEGKALQVPDQPGAVPGTPPR